MSTRSARIVASGATALVLSGCAQQGVVPYRIAVPSDPGSPSDAEIAAAHLDGYDVVGECGPHLLGAGALIVVRGQGRRQIVRGAEHGWNDEMVAFRARAAAVLGDLAVLVWWDPSGCRQSGPTLVARVGAYAHYRDAIARLGALLRDEELGDDVEVTLFRTEVEDVGPLDRESGCRSRGGRSFPTRRARSRARATTPAGMRCSRSISDTCGAGNSRLVRRPAGSGASVSTRVPPQVRRRMSGRLGLVSGSGARSGNWRLKHRGRARTAARTRTRQIGTAWSTTDRARAIVPSVGLTSLALGELIVAEYNRAGPSAYLLLLPLAALDHVEVAWEFGLDPRGVRGASVLFGFSL